MHTPWKNLAPPTPKTIRNLYLLIGINIAVFFIAVIFPAANEYLPLPAYLPLLANHFWAPITYMFLNYGFFAIIFNMLWLYWMGQLFEDVLGEKRLTGVYLLGGLAGAILFVLCFNVLPVFTHVHAAAYGAAAGSSACVIAVIVALGTQMPNYQVQLFLLGPVKLKWLVIFYLAIDLINLTGPNPGSEIAHLGGALFGFVYIKQLNKGNDWVAAITGIFKPKPNLKVASRNSSKSASVLPRQEEIDRILDKISTNGYESLSKAEKEILFRASKNES